jgi:hypothetical protein
MTASEAWPGQPASVNRMCSKTFRARHEMGSRASPLKGVVMKKGWRWAYAKIRSFHCNRWVSFYRSTRYALLNDSGPVNCKTRNSVIRLKRRAWWY